MRLPNGISIIVPTHNRAPLLQRCVASLQSQRCDFLFEIIIVNDYSSDGTRAYLDSLNDPRISVIHHKENRGPSAARNSGIQAARYPFLAFIDDDCVTQPHWISNLYETLTGGADIVVGSTYYVSREYAGHYPERVVQNRKAEWPMTCNIAYAKKVFDACGLFDSAFDHFTNEDSEMALRAISHGFSIERNTNAVVYHSRQFWTVSKLLSSAKNRSVWPILKSRYPHHFRLLGGPAKRGWIIDPFDYFLLILLPIAIPVLFIRYLLRGGHDVLFFFAKWPVWLILKRLHIYYQAIRNRVWIL